MSRIKLIRADIATVLEETEPPHDATVPYRRVRQLDRTNPVIPRRHFYAAAPVSAQQTEFGSNFSVDRYTFVIVVRLPLAGKTFDDMFDDFMDEGVLLKNRINAFTGWNAEAHVRGVGATGFRLEPATDDEVNLVISCFAECEESDGYS